MKFLHLFSQKFALGVPTIGQARRGDEAEERAAIRRHFKGIFAPLLPRKTESLKQTITPPLRPEKRDDEQITENGGSQRCGIINRSRLEVGFREKR